MLAILICVQLIVVANCDSSIPGQYVSYQSLSSTYQPLNGTLRKRSVDVIDTDTLIVQGPSLYYETLVQKSLAHFNRERIPERVVHAKGSTFYGTFHVTNAEISRYTKASVFSVMNVKTQVAVRFSTQLGERGAPDTPFGEVRGFGVKFYTDQGNYDLLSINIPVFFINDPQLFVQLNHAQKRDPRSDFKSSDNQWDFFSLRPETLNGITFVYSDYGLPNGYRHMPGFSVNSFRLVNHKNQRYFARFMWLPRQGIQNLNRSEATRLAGEDPDYARRDLFESIENKHSLPSWTLNIQLITVEEVETSFAYNPFDPTKLWPFDRFPPIEVGIMTLDRNVNNAFAENEQIALNPANLVPGIEPSPDRLLRGRLFAYRDTQVYRLGANHLLIPVNQDQKNILSERDAAYRTDANFGSLPNYYPNSRFHGQSSLYDIVPAPFSFEVDDIFLLKSDSLQQQYQHARQSYLSFTSKERHSLHQNLAFALSSVIDVQIIQRMLTHFHKISPEYAKAIRKELIKYNKWEL